MHVHCSLCFAGLGFLKAAELLIRNGADVNAIGQRGSTPLQRASHQCFEKIAELLIYEKHANVNALDFDRNSALQFAAGRGKSNVQFSNRSSLSFREI